MAYDPVAVRRQFPIFDVPVEGRRLIYLDTAATSQKPKAVLEAMQHFYTHDNANINRGVHPLAERATTAYDNARKRVAQFIGARHAHEILFTRNATEAVNLVARSWGASHIRRGHGIAVSIWEHHSNVVPWLQLKDEKEASLQWIDMDNACELRLDQLQTALAKHNVKLVAVTGLSNVLGTLAPLGEIIDMAHAHGAKVLVDAAQLIVHKPIDVQTLDADFLVFSGHKLYGPTGIGVLYGKMELLKDMPPFLGGGDMIQSVEQQRFTIAELPRKFEAGTPPIAEAIGLQTAMDWLDHTGREDIERHERKLIARAMNGMRMIKGLTILGSGDSDATHGCISFTLDRVHPHDLTEILGRKGICLRAGHHCTQPLHKRLGIAASTRLSVGAYTTEEDIDACIAAIEQAKLTMKA
ncbi:MAG TPA: SufS family cysteine desulfurase [Candidatus Peribacteria bacterium]|nr:SufS family cysteine desulfurase [Candidatus Peribacteria bacterium]